jgi:hypothetical protein
VLSATSPHHDVDTGGGGPTTTKRHPPARTNTTHEHQPSTRPQPCELLLAGWIAGANGQERTNEDRGGTNERHKRHEMTPASMNERQHPQHGRTPAPQHERTPCHERQPSTRPHRCEPLLAGWIAGANGHQCIHSLNPPPTAILSAVELRITSPLSTATAANQNRHVTGGQR